MKGSIIKRGENSYQINIYRGKNSAGRSIYYRETFVGSPKEAETYLAQTIADMSRGEFVEPTKLTLYQFLIDYFLPKAQADLTPTAYRAYESIVETHIKPDRIGQIKLTGLELIHFEEYKLRKLKAKCRPPKRSEKLVKKLEKKDPDKLKPKTLSPKTIKNQLIMLKAAMVYACKLKILKYSPAQYLEFPHVNKYKPVVLDETGADKFLTAAESDRFYLIYILALYFGKRQGEIRGLRKQDVDFENLTAAIRQAAHGSGYKAEFGDTKTDESNKPLELEKWMVPLFKAEFKLRAAEELAYGAGYSKNDLVFASYNGNTVKENKLREHFYKILEVAGLPRMRFHDLRHSCATLLLKRGIHPKVAQERLAHAVMSTTMHNYSHVIPTMQREANKVMDKIFKVKAQ
jgi:integrase